MNTLLEVCVDSLESARAAVRGGADRLELCSALAAGGLTPYQELLEQIKKETDIPVRCLMRPRAGDFLYSQEEIRQMERQIHRLKAAGADGFAIGCLTPDGQLDAKGLEPLIEAAGESGLTLHRCIDVSRDPEDTYAAAARLGLDTVLTSGAKSSALAGLSQLEALTAARDRIGGPEILVGAGVNAKVISQIRDRIPGLRAFHMSGKTLVESGMHFRRADVPMGLPGLDEWHIQQTNAEAVAMAKAALKRN